MDTKDRSTRRWIHSPSITRQTLGTDLVARATMRMVARVAHSSTTETQATTTISSNRSSSNSSSCRVESPAVNTQDGRSRAWRIRTRWAQSGAVHRASLAAARSNRNSPTDPLRNRWPSGTTRRDLTMEVSSPTPSPPTASPWSTSS